MVPLPDSDRRLRQAAFALLLNTHAPVSQAHLAEVTGLRLDSVRAAVARLAATGWIDRAEDGRILGSEGLSIGTGPHRLQLPTGIFQTWCAYDSLGIAAALGADATIETACAVCRRKLTIDMNAGAPGPGRSERLWLADGGSDLRADFCTPTVLLCSADHAGTWAAQHEERGKALDLEEGAHLGAAAWAPSAGLARMLADQAASADAIESGSTI